MIDQLGQELLRQVRRRIDRVQHELCLQLLLIDPGIDRVRDGIPQLACPILDADASDCPDSISR